jgi:UDP-N-acetylmuramoyl-L-alanyl-D-glutamate--2,6-diaminopimelate ligase
VSAASPRQLHELLRSAGLAVDPPRENVAITHLTADSRDARPGSLFVAIPGTRVDGHRFIGDAVRAGAAVVLAQRAPAESTEVPLVHVTDARRALALLAAAWHDHPARAFPLVGITGTVGKTSVLTMMEAILRAAGRRVGTVGSLGLRIDGTTVEESSYTVPEPLMLHRQLGELARAGCDIAVMEVTSHALVQQRVAGIEYSAGVFTNLVPLEHAEFHRNFRAYVEAKSRFLDHLLPGAPVVYNADDRAVRRLMHDRPIVPVGCGSTRGAVVRVRTLDVATNGTSLLLDVRRELPRIDGGAVAPVRIPLRLALLGRSNIGNAALAATAGLCAGADPETAQAALATLPAPRRRMEVLQREPFTILDDTVGHPDSVSVVFETVERLAPRRVHAVWAVRGRRGRRINRYNAEALAIWAKRVPLGTLVVTRSREAADERNRVEDAEYAAFVRPLEKAHVRFDAIDDLAPAVTRVLERAQPGDLVLLLGAQGMDPGAAIARDRLGRTG